MLLQEIRLMKLMLLVRNRMMSLYLLSVKKTV